MRLAYHLLDVFTDRPLAGNPLAVVTAADGLSGARMQALAREFNLSETVFILEPREKINTARLRIFTPSMELPFAGHPTVGAACLIASLRAPESLGCAPLRLVLEEEIGPVCCDVSLFRDAIRAQFSAPLLPEVVAASFERGIVADALGLTEDEIGFDAHATSVASAGLPFAFVPVAGVAALNRVVPDRSRLDAVFGLTQAAVCVYSKETADPAHHVSARVFVPGLGAGEDPATGSAACAFAAVACVFEQPEDGEHNIVIEQGFAMGRPSLISLTIQVTGGVLGEVRVGGATVRIGEGFLTLRSSEIRA